jgi:hypothetical protein
VLIGYIRDQLDAEGRECSILYNAASPGFYRRFGWVQTPNEILRLKLLEGDASPPEGVRTLSAVDLRDIIQRDVEITKARFDNQKIGEGEAHVLFPPGWEFAEWNFAKEDAMAKALGGFKAWDRGVATAEGDAWLYWTHAIARSELQILRIGWVDGGEKNLKSLLAAAVAEARESGLSEVIVSRESTGEIRKAASLLEQDRVVELSCNFDDGKKAAVPSVRWKGASDGKRVLWEENELYSYC